MKSTQVKIKLSEFSESQINDIKNIEDKIFSITFRDKVCFYLIKDVGIIKEEVIKKRKFKSDALKTEKFLVLSLFTYNQTGDYIGYIKNPDNASFFLRRFILSVCEKNYRDIKQAISKIEDFNKNFSYK